MRTLCLALWSAFLLVAVSASGWAEDLPRAKVIGVLVSADWCEDCKEMEEAGQDLMDRFDGEPILGIVLDVTNLSTRYHARLLAGTLGLDEIHRQKVDSLGKIFLVDGKSKVIIDTITDEDDFETMADKVRNALSSR